MKTNDSKEIKDVAPGVRNEGLADEPHSLPPTMRRVITWGVLIGAGCVGLSYLIFLIYWTWQREGWVKEVVQQHFPATVGLPLSAVGAFLLVTVLQISAGKIEFEAFGFKLKGASGPVILWVVSFLAVTVGIKLLW